MSRIDPLVGKRSLAVWAIFCLVAANGLTPSCGVGAEKSNVPLEAASQALSSTLPQVDLKLPPVTLDDVPRLLRELGDEAYSVRRRAEEQLIALGPSAFDLLKQTEDAIDLEVAARVRHILYTIRVAWTQPSDPAEVRTLLSNYGELPYQERRGRIVQLSELPGGKGLSGLCRIARYDASPLAARLAALAAVGGLARSEAPMPRPKARQRSAMQLELGKSDRLPVRWIAAYLCETSDSRNAAQQWEDVVAEEIVLWRSQSNRTERPLVEGLIRCQLSWLAQASRTESSREVESANRSTDDERSDELTDALTDALAIWIDLDVSESSSVERIAGLESALEWTIENSQWSALDRLQAKYAPLFAANRLLVYMAATGYARQSRDVEADALADRAFQLESDDANRRAFIAERLVSQGQIDWALREFRQAIALLPLPSAQGMLARSELATWLHDREEYQDAAQAMGDLCDAIDSDPAIRTQLLEDLQQLGDAHDKLRAFTARRHFYDACRYESEGRFDEQLAALQLAVEANEEDADVLIALYHCDAADDQAKANILARIRAISQKWLALIEEHPDVAFLYNQWAWLIANTEGDFQQAVRFSQRSLILQPNEASYLDTLGRCYFAVDDLANAVMVQRRAVKLQPSMQVMQRQLALFEKQFAQRQP